MKTQKVKIEPLKSDIVFKMYKKGYGTKFKKW
jgi:hypothetical protein